MTRTRIKNRLRHFWRNNKSCIAMYNVFVNTIAAFCAAFAHTYISAIYLTMFVFTWLIVWVLDREILFLKRVHYIN